MGRGGTGERFGQRRQADPAALPQAPLPQGVWIALFRAVLCCAMIWMLCYAVRARPNFAGMTCGRPGTELIFE